LAPGRLPNPLAEDEQTACHRAAKGEHRGRSGRFFAIRLERLDFIARLVAIHPVATLSHAELPWGARAHAMLATPTGHLARILNLIGHLQLYDQPRELNCAIDGVWASREHL
jgi:hypothetical protein